MSQKPKKQEAQFKRSTHTIEPWGRKWMTLRARKEEQTLERISKSFIRGNWTQERHVLFGKCSVDLVVANPDRTLLIEVKPGPCSLPDIMQHSAALRIAEAQSKGKSSFEGILVCEGATEKAKDYAEKSGIRIIDSDDELSDLRHSK